MLRTTVAVSLVCLALSAVVTVIPAQAADFYAGYRPVIERIYFVTAYSGGWLMRIEGKNFTPYTQVLIDGEVAPSTYGGQGTIMVVPEPTGYPEPHRVQLRDGWLMSNVYKAEFGWNQ